MSLLNDPLPFAVFSSGLIQSFSCFHANARNLKIGLQLRGVDKGDGSPAKGAITYFCIGEVQRKCLRARGQRSAPFGFNRGPSARSLPPVADQRIWPTAIIIHLDRRVEIGNDVDAWVQVSLKLEEPTDAPTKHASNLQKGHVFKPCPKHGQVLHENQVKCCRRRLTTPG